MNPSGPDKKDVTTVGIKINNSDTLKERDEKDPYRIKNRYDGDRLDDIFYDGRLRNATLNQNTDVQFRPYFKDPDITMFNMMRTPNWEKAEDRAFIDFKYIPENGQTYKRERGQDKIWNDHLRDENRRYKDAMWTPMEYMPTGTNFDMPWGAEQKWVDRPDKPKRRRIGTNVTDSMLGISVEPPYQKLNPDYTGAHQKSLSSFKLNYGTENYMYTSTMDGTKPEYLPEMTSVPKIDLKKPRFKNESRELRHMNKNADYFNLCNRLYKNSLIKN